MSSKTAFTSEEKSSDPPFSHGNTITMSYGSEEMDNEEGESASSMFSTSRRRGSKIPIQSSSYVDSAYNLRGNRRSDGSLSDESQQVSSFTMRFNKKSIKKKPIKRLTFFDTLKQRGKIFAPNLTTTDMKNMVAEEMNKKPEVPVGYVEPAFLLETTKDKSRPDKYNTILLQARDLFMNEFSVHMKLEEKDNLEELEVEEDIKVNQEEVNLENYANFFSEFIKRSDQICREAEVEIMKETMLRLNKMSEVKNLQTTISALNSTLVKMEENLLQMICLELFLDSLAPPTWGVKKQKELHMQGSDNVDVDSWEDEIIKDSTGSFKIQTFEKDMIDLDVYLENENLTDPAQIYFDDPEQVIDLLIDLEKSNITLIQHNQETMEALDEARETFQVIAAHLDEEAGVLRNQFEAVERTIELEMKKSKTLEAMINEKNDLISETDNDDEMALLAKIHSEVYDLYKCCFGMSGSNLDPLIMLTQIEDYLITISEKRQSYPRQQIDKVLRSVFKQRVIIKKEKEEKLKLLLQEERLKKLLIPQLEENLRPLKKLVFRSEPPHVQKALMQVDKAKARAKAEEEEYLYFFT